MIPSSDPALLVMNSIIFLLSEVVTVDVLKVTLRALSGFIDEIPISPLRRFSMSLLVYSILSRKVLQGKIDHCKARMFVVYLEQTFYNGTKWQLSTFFHKGTITRSRKISVKFYLM
jgi:hypothetical protein